MDEQSEQSADETATAPGEPAAPVGITKEELKSAYNAFKKRWKLTALDQESRIGRNPLSSGQKSSIAGIRPPNQFSQEIWDELTKQGRIKHTGGGFYAMP
jgi:hypothetical protein